MRFLLTGVETNNKGAELMFYAILQEIERKFPNSTIYIESKRLKQGIEYINTSLQIVPIENKIDTLINKCGINRIFRKIGISPLELYPSIPKIDYMLDGSGLLFSDYMDRTDLISYISYFLRKSKKQGAKIVFLPQAFGPIKKHSTKIMVDMLFKYADLIYAREQVSYEYLREYSPENIGKVKKNTDFTSLVEGLFPSQYKHLRNGVCIIPNMQMVRKGNISLSDYINYIKRLCDELKCFGHPIYLLNHEGRQDERLLTMCKNVIGGEITTVTGLNALETKGLISSAYIVITSRFHGLASALNSGVPSLATSWSHKYKCLFDDYNQDNGVLSISNYEEDIKKIKETMNPEYNKRIKNDLFKSRLRIDLDVRNMWSTVWNLK